MQWEIVLAIILAIGVGIAIAEALKKRSRHRKENTGMLLNQHSHDESKNELTDE
jgi:hypothetical protein